MMPGALPSCAALLMALAIQPVSRQPSLSPVRVVESVDLARYAGQWFEIARLPNKAQTPCVSDVVTRYALRSDGRLDVVNRCRTAAATTTEARGLVRAQNKTGMEARLQMRFGSAFRALFGGAWNDYWILGIGPDYTWAVAGSPSRDRLWILSRTPEMSASSYEQALAIASGNGFDVNRLIKTAQNTR